jgi:uncharacterized protein YjbJ (UPF0337 family)
MDWNQIEGNWRKMKGKVKERWGDFTDDEIDRMQGKKENLVGELMARYGMSREEAERQAEDFGSGITLH